MKSDEFRDAWQSDGFRDALESNIFRDAFKSQAFLDMMNSDSFLFAMRSDAFSDALQSDAFLDAWRSDAYRDALESDAFLDALESGNVAAREITLWSRRRADGLVPTPVEGIDQVVCGHTITPDREIHRYANVWFVDTGAFLSDAGSGHLTLLPLDSLFQHGDSNAVRPNSTL